MKLYMIPPSGNALKVRTLISVLKIPCEEIVVTGKQLEAPELRKLSPRGQVPIIEDDGRTIWDSSACLIYVARRFGGEAWYPSAPADMAEVAQWLALAGNEIQFGLQYARREIRQGRTGTERLAYFQELGRLAMQTLESRLSSHDWVALDRVTIGDVACFAYVNLAPDAGIPLESYPGVARWLARCKSIPGWLTA